jgi:hypothetical protein
MSAFLLFFSGVRLSHSLTLHCPVTVFGSILRAWPIPAVPQIPGEEENGSMRKKDRDQFRNRDRHESQEGNLETDWRGRASQGNP